MKPLRLPASGVALLMLCSVSAFGQARGTTPGPPQPDRARVSLRVQVVIAKFKGETRMSSVPFVMTVTANDRKSVVQSGTQVLIPMMTTEGKTVGPVYKDVGTRIECSATSLDAAHYRLELQVEDSTLSADEQSATSALTSAPYRIRTFRSDQTLVLSPGETVQYTTAQDKQSGEEVRVTVSIAALSTLVAR